MTNEKQFTLTADKINAYRELGKEIAKSGMFGIDKLEQGTVIAWQCDVEGLSPFQVLQTRSFVCGRLSMRADAMLGEFRKLGGECKWLTALSDTKEAKARFKFKENDLELTYTIEDATREGNAGRNLYKSYAPDMLRARLVSKALRMIAPEVIAGVYLPDEKPIESDEPSPTPTAKPLLPTQQLAEALKTEPAPAKKAPPTLEAEVVTTPSKAEAKKPEAATVTPPSDPPPKAEPSKPAQDLGKLDELFTKLQPHAEKVTAWLTLKGWLTSDQVCDKTFAEVCAALKTVHIDKILAAPDRFIAACNR